MINGTVEAVRLIEHISEGLDYCEVTIDFDMLKMFGKYNDIMEYMNKRVQYTVRYDMYNGEKVQVIANLANMFTVQTLKEDVGIKLIPEVETSRAVCNFSVRGVKFGDYEVDCIGFLASWEKGQSPKSTWIDCTVIDRDSKVFVLRKFTSRVEAGVDPYATIDSLVGSYIKFDVSYTQYGYQCAEIELYNVPVVMSPEVDIAISIISNAVADDKELVDYLTQYDYINALKSIIYYEFGYHLVYIAAEIFMINSISNISREYSKETLIRAAIVSRGYLLPAKAKYSRMLLNTDRLRRSSLAADRELMLLLDVLSEEEPSVTKRVYIQTSKFVKVIVDERRGINNEKVDYANSIDNLHDVYGGLC